MAQHGLGAPESRPEEDTCIIAATFEIDRDRCTWEQTAAIAWVVDAPRRLAPAAVERLLRDRLRLCRGDVAVCRHFPEEFVLKFESKEMCSAALDKGRLRMHDGTQVFVKPGRPLAHAMGAAMPFSARLLLDGVPAYVWTHSIVERVIGRTCALDVMDERSISMTDTREIGLWAWTSNPRRIPKVVWLTFTSRAPDGVRVIPRQPARCLRGATFRVLVHLEHVEDYTSAPLDLETEDGRPVPYSPPTSVFPPCHRGTIDGHAPVSTDDVLIPGEFDSRGTTTGGAPRARGSGDGCPDFRTQRRDDDRDDHDDQVGGRDRGNRRPGHDNGAPPPRPRSCSPRRRDGGAHGNGGRRHASGLPPPSAEAGGCFRQMGVVALAEAKIRRVFGSREADDRAALRAAMLREAADLRLLLALPAAPAMPSGPLPDPPVLLGAVVPVAAGTEAWDDFDAGAGLTCGLGALSLGSTPPGFGSALPGPSSASCVSPARSLPSASELCATSSTPVLVAVVSPGDTASPVRTSEATPLLASALLGPYPRVAASALGTAVAGADAAPPASGALDLFLGSVVGTPPAPLLLAPVPRPSRALGINLSSPRRSCRLAQKKTKQCLQGSSVVQELLARACGLLGPDEALDDGVKDAYGALFNTPLTAQVIQAIEALAKHVKAASSKAGKKKLAPKSVQDVADV